MPCPFPGMDPYLERSPIWPDFHDSLIYCLRGALVPLLRPKFAVLTQVRLYVTESEPPVFPDVAFVQTASPGPKAGGATVMELDSPVVFELWREEIRQPLLEIVEPAAGNRVVTAIEVLSPDNKQTGAGRSSYLQKREEFWNSGVNLVEIDLLRQGDPTVRVATEKLERLRPWHYLVAVTRRWPSRQEVYAVPLPRRLPRIAVPLGAEDADVGLDLQAVFTRCWDEGPYPELLKYDGPPPGKLSPEEVQWCEQQLRAGGFRPTG